MPCHVCGKMLSSAYISDHMKVHSQGPHHVCELCNKGVCRGLLGGQGTRGGTARGPATDGSSRCLEPSRKQMKQHWDHWTSLSFKRSWLEEMICQKESISEWVWGEWAWAMAAWGRSGQESQCPGWGGQGFGSAATSVRLWLVEQVEYVGRGLTSTHSAPVAEKRIRLLIV